MTILFSQYASLSFSTTCIFTLRRGGQISYVGDGGSDNDVHGGEEEDKASFLMIKVSKELEFLGTRKSYIIKS